MNPKHTWIWLFVAAGLFAFIFFFERHLQRAAPGPSPLLPGFKASAVSSVRVLPAGQSEIRVERTNSAWLMTRPIAAAAAATQIEKLLATLEQLVPATVVSPGELKHRPQAEVEFGFENPLTSLVLQDGGANPRIQIGAHTAPGDQVFLRVVGREDVFVVDAEFLALLPRGTNDWRDAALIDLRALAFDRITITNATGPMELQLDPTNGNWRMLRPMQTRADGRRILESLQALQSLRIEQFVADGAPADLEPFGLQRAALDLGFQSGTNPVALLHFGKSPTNAPAQFFARREGFNSIVTVPAESLTNWSKSFSHFRNRHLLAWPAELGEIEVRGREGFVLQRVSSNSWQVASQKFPVDAARAEDFLTTLKEMEIIEFVKDAITDPDLRTYGLTSPVYQVILKSTAQAGVTNPPLVQLSFGTNVADKVFARRADEDSVYAVKLADFLRLPAAGWQLRARRIWNFNEGELARVTIRQGAKTRGLLRAGTNSWTFAPGSQGVINEFAVEETAHRFGELTATAWSAHGDAAREARFGFGTNSLALSFELKRGEKLDVEFGDVAPSGYPYARVALEGEPWVFECALGLYQLMLTYLAIPPTVP